MVAIVILCWNFLDYTKDAVASILRNKGDHDVKLIFVDNGSTDGTGEYLKTVSDSIVITNEQNMYIRHAYNQGFGAALDIPEVEVLGSISTDCVMCPRFLDPVVKAVQEDIWCASYQIGINTGEIEDLSTLDSICESYLDIPPDDPSSITGKRGHDALHTTWFNAHFMSRKIVELWYPLPSEINVYVDRWLELFLMKYGYKVIGLYDSLFYHRYQKSTSVLAAEAQSKMDGYSYAWEMDKNGFLKLVTNLLIQEYSK